MTNFSDPVILSFPVLQALYFVINLPIQPKHGSANIGHATSIMDADGPIRILLWGGIWFNPVPAVFALTVAYSAICITAPDYAYCIQNTYSAERISRVWSKIAALSSSKNDLTIPSSSLIAKSPTVSTPPAASSTTFNHNHISNPSFVASPDQATSLERQTLYRLISNAAGGQLSFTSGRKSSLVRFTEWDWQLPGLAAASLLAGCAALLLWRRLFKQRSGPKDQETIRRLEGSTSIPVHFTFPARRLRTTRIIKSSVPEPLILSPNASNSEAPRTVNHSPSPRSSKDSRLPILPISEPQTPRSNSEVRQCYKGSLAQTFDFSLVKEDNSAGQILSRMIEASPNVSNTSFLVSASDLTQELQEPSTALAPGTTNNLAKAQSRVMNPHAMMGVLLSGVDFAIERTRLKAARPSTTPSQSTQLMS